MEIKIQSIESGGTVQSSQAGHRSEQGGKPDGFRTRFYTFRREGKRYF